ncbi:MAG: hypothetical protein AAF363_20405 [Bacteroidota bacterium]
MGEMLRPVSGEDHRGYRKYRIKGIDRDIIARKGGPTKQQIKESDSYQVLRKNQNEFGAASKLAKSIRNSFSSEVAKLCGSYVSGKLTALVRNTIKKSEGEKGKRPVLISGNKADLIGFDFDSGKKFEEVFRARYHLKPGSQFGHFIFHCSTFIPEESIIHPKGATHFKLYNHVVGLSDMKYQESSESYDYLESNSNGCHATETSELLPITRLNLEPFYFSLSLNGVCQKQKEHLSLAVLMGIQFYQFESGKYKECKEGNAISIVQMV